MEFPFEFAKILVVFGAVFFIQGYLDGFLFGYGDLVEDGEFDRNGFVVFNRNFVRIGLPNAGREDFFAFGKIFGLYPLDRNLFVAAQGNQHRIGNRLRIQEGLTNVGILVKNIGRTGKQVVFAVIGHFGQQKYGGI